MRSAVFFGLALCLGSTGAYAGVTINGTTITFNDATMQSTANPPSDHGGTATNVSGTNAFVGGGEMNAATAIWATVSGGFNNTASGDASTVGGGSSNFATSTRSTISGGILNAASGDHSTVGGGYYNRASGYRSTVGGGSSNFVTDDYATIGGGQNNQAGNNAGGTADRRWATVGGGQDNTASGYRSTVGGGFNNMAGGKMSTVGGGNSNIASGYRSTVGGGFSNQASALNSTVGGGYNNRVTWVYATISGGRSNSASGYASTVAGGSDNRARGVGSFAAGKSAYAFHDNSFVWGDENGGISSGNNTFNIHASGGIYLNGVEAHSSDRNKKKDFSFVSAREILDKVVELPIQTWRFKTEEDSISHIGPMAQDFMAAFGYGLDERYLSTLDVDGVTLAAIQGLYAMQREELQEQAEVNTALRWHNEQLKAILRSRDESFEARFARLEKAILRDGGRAPTDSTD